MIIQNTQSHTINPLTSSLSISIPETSSITPEENSFPGRVLSCLAKALPCCCFYSEKNTLSQNSSTENIQENAKISTLARKHLSRESLLETRSASPPTSPFHYSCHPPYPGSLGLYY